MDKFTITGKIQLIKTFVFRRMVMKNVKEIVLTEISPLLTDFNLSVDNLENEQWAVVKNGNLSFVNFNEILEDNIEVMDGYNRSVSEVIVNLINIMKKKNVIVFSDPLLKNIDYSSYLNEMLISGMIDMTENGFVYGENPEYKKKMRDLIKNYNLKKKFLY